MRGHYDFDHSAQMTVFQTYNKRESKMSRNLMSMKSGGLVIVTGVTALFFISLGIQSNTSRAQTPVAPIRPSTEPETQLINPLSADVVRAALPTLYTSDAAPVVAPQLGSAPATPPASGLSNPHWHPQPVQLARPTQAMTREEIAEMQAALEQLKSSDTDLDTQNAARNKLVELLSKEFDEDLEQRAKQVAELEKQIVTLKEQIEKRRGAKSRLVELRIELLMNEAQGLGFPQAWNGPFVRQTDTLIYQNVPGGYGVRSYAAPRSQPSAAPLPTLPPAPVQTLSPARR